MYKLLVSLARSIAPRMRGASLYQVEAMLHEGRISQRDYEVYYLFWLWSAPRYGGDGELWQNRYYLRRGFHNLHKRYDMFRAAGIDGGLD